MTVEILVSRPVESDFISELDLAVKTRGKDSLEVKVLQAWMLSWHWSGNVRWDVAGQLDPQVISDVISWVLCARQAAFENIPVTRISLINLIKKQVLSSKQSG